MALLLAPYTNAMRLGQGFNSYTQQICIDDATKIHSQALENQVDNSGMTMKSLGVKINKLKSFETEYLITRKPKLPPSGGDDEPEEKPEPEPTEPGEGTKDPKKPKPEPNTPDEPEEGGEKDDAKEGSDVKIDTPEAESGEKKEEGGKVSEEPKKDPKEDLKKKRKNDEDDDETPAERKARRKKQNEEAEKRARDAATVDHTTKLIPASATDANVPTLLSQDLWKFDSEIIGPSQVVTYTSRFVDKLSDITDALNVSGSLSIKYGAIGGSGKGQFIDSDKFRDSDLNFFIQVKVVNQTINLKDSLEFNPLTLGDSAQQDGTAGGLKDAQTFNKIFGDTFISGFIEGGEFNALISMKIMDKSKTTDIAAKAKIALTVGPGSVEAAGEVRKQKGSLEKSTETTIQVSWSGGGHIKSFNEPWDIDSVVRAASRFPDLVARTPQRIYAILTKYEALRSYVEKGPKHFSKLVYENAAMYTNFLLDSFMDYKNIYKMLSTNMEEIEAGRYRLVQPSDGEKAKSGLLKDGKAKDPTPEFVDELPSAQNEDTDDTPPSSGSEDKPKDKKKSAGSKKRSQDGDKREELPLGDPRRIKDVSPFAATIEGLEMARKATRFQMLKIVNEVDLITADPSIACKENRPDIIQSPNFFRTRIPKVEAKREANVTLGEAAKDDTPEAVHELTTPKARDSNPEHVKQWFDNRQQQQPLLGKDLKADSALGFDKTQKTDLKLSFFKNLEFLQPDFVVQRMQGAMYKGTLHHLSLDWTNGLRFIAGRNGSYSPVTTGDWQAFPSFEFESLENERVTSCKVEVGKRSGDGEIRRVVGLSVYTNRGRSHELRASADKWERKEGKLFICGEEYTDYETRFYDCPLLGGQLKGFWGQSYDSRDEFQEVGVYAIGPIWGIDREKMV